MDFSTQLNQDMRLMSRGFGPHGALLCVTSASLITVTRNDPDVDKLFIPVVVCHNNGGNLQTPSYIVP